MTGTQGIVIVIRDKEELIVLRAVGIEIDIEIIGIVPMVIPHSQCHIHSVCLQKKLYITDSDDGSTSELREYEVKAESGNAKVMLKGYTNYYPFALYPISGYDSANR
jgi:hypothetical protein